MRILSLLFCLLVYSRPFSAEKCDGEIDLLTILDGPGGKEQPWWNDVVDTLAYIATKDLFQDDYWQIYAGWIDFARPQRRQWDMNEYFYPEYLNYTHYKVDYEGEIVTWTENSLQEAERFFRHESTRENASRVIIMFTDGNFENAEASREAASKLKTELKVFLVVVGMDSFSRPELETIASFPDFVYDGSSLAKLNNLREELYALLKAVTCLPDPDLGMESEGEYLEPTSATTPAPGPTSATTPAPGPTSATTPASEPSPPGPTDSDHSTTTEPTPCPSPSTGPTYSTTPAPGPNPPGPTYSTTPAPGPNPPGPTYSTTPAPGPNPPGPTYTTTPAPGSTDSDQSTTPEPTPCLSPSNSPPPPGPTYATTPAPGPTYATTPAPGPNPPGPSHVRISVPGLNAPVLTYTTRPEPGPNTPGPSYTTTPAPGPI